jgi:hypothetical protein
LADAILDRLVHHTPINTHPLRRPLEPGVHAPTQAQDTFTRDRCSVNPRPQRRFAPRGGPHASESMGHFIGLAGPLPPDRVGHFVGMRNTHREGGVADPHPSLGDGPRWK